MVHVPRGPLQHRPWVETVGRLTHTLKGVALPSFQPSAMTDDQNKWPSSEWTGVCGRRPATSRTRQVRGTRYTRPRAAATADRFHWSIIRRETEALV